MRLGLQGKAGGLGPIRYGTSKLPTRANDPLTPNDYESVDLSTSPWLEFAKWLKKY